MDISFYESSSLRFRRPLLTPWSRMDCFYDGWMCFFWTLESGVPFTAIVGLGGAMIFFYVTPNCVRLKEDTPHIHLGWLEDAGLSAVAGSSLMEAAVRQRDPTSSLLKRG